MVSFKSMFKWPGRLQWLQFAKCLIAVLFAAWLLYPYPYTWEGLEAIHPALGYGRFIPVAWYMYLMYKARYSNAKA
jgi:hypothetical protein